MHNKEKDSITSRVGDLKSFYEKLIIKETGL